VTVAKAPSRPETPTPLSTPSNSPISRTSPGAPTLILVPTALERDRLAPDLPAGSGLIELCGFGPVASAARTSQLVARIQPRRVWLVGIAGTYDSSAHPVGSATTFGEVLLDGVGAGEGPSRLAPGDLGFPQWSEPISGARPDVVDRLTLETSGARLLSVTAASASPAQAEERHERFASAAEDMEAFGVALACHLAHTPCGVVRGISNLAGDRVTSGWDIEGALSAAGRTLAALLNANGPA